ncbi:MAG: NAD(P)H-hydrate dehydratase [Myxococcota bacterium]
MPEAPTVLAPHPVIAPGAPWPLVTAAEMGALDRHTIRTLGVAGEVLMESAGRAVVEAVLDVLQTEASAVAGDAEVVVVCGTGNNGGDGLVVARQLHVLGVPVRAALLGDPKKLRGDAAANWKRARAAGVPLEGPRWKPPRRGVLVDAIFGTGLARKVEGTPAAAIRRINAARDLDVWVLAVDLPSGIDSDTGQVHGVAVEADCTVTMSLPKLGLAVEPGRTRAGETLVARIGIADAAPGVVPSAELWTPAAAGWALPPRPVDGHKGSFGHVLLVAGGEGKTGAAALAASAAVRGGAGLVTLACPAGLNDVLEVKCTEAMTVPVADTERRCLAAAAEDAVVGLATERDVVACGPGIGRARETGDLVRALAKRVEGPLVLDADGLFPFAGAPETLRARQAPTLLTPHPGEAARLLGTTVAKLSRDRPGAARGLAERTGAVVVLKGAATLVADPSGRLAVNPTGGPALASGGTGDVLTGLVAAMLAQGLPAFEAACAAVYVHGEAGDAHAREHGEAGLAAGDLARALPAAAERLRRAAQGDEEAEVGRAGLLLSFPGR